MTMAGGTDRRGFMGLAAGLSFAPGVIGRALAIAPAQAKGSIEDVEHIVIHMQENRSFDHYFGALNGVRGFGDPRPLRLPGGRSVWLQPSDEHRDGHVMPFHGDSRTTRSLTVDGAEQSHQENITIFNEGRFDLWGHTRQLHRRMLRYGASDLPFYYALADAFTICDAYHCSTMTQTYPNRLHLFTGCNGGGGVGGDPQMHNYGEDETPSADMAEDKPLEPGAYHWTTYAERLEAAGVSWKVYQEYDNFGDNLLSIFPNFRPCEKESNLYKRGRSWVSEHKEGADRTRSDGEQLVEAFRADLAAGTLPQVSWIVTAADLSEHPDHVPARGEHVTAKLIEALVDHPEVFAKTVFILTYDEAGGFYDHAPPPVPPLKPEQGFSTVSVEGEAKDYAAQHVANPGRHPIGLGIRVPTIVVSPWSRGGYVCSELFDHTSVIRFVERRFGVREPNISAWRRSVCGDLTSTLDFSRRDPQRSTLPDTQDFMERIARSAAGSPNNIPADQQPTAQMEGQRSARPLPYAFSVAGQVTAERRFRLSMANRGGTGVVLTVHDRTDRQAPWHYTIGAGHEHDSEQWHDAGPLDAYDIVVRGPDGFLQRYAGGLDSKAVMAEAGLAPGKNGEARLMLGNRTDRPLHFIVRLDEAYACDGPRERRIVVPARQTATQGWSLAKSDGWHDFSIRLAEDARFERRFAGRLTGTEKLVTDPAIGAMRLEA
jgi:phospholipase C